MYKRRKEGKDRRRVYEKRDVKQESKMPFVM